MVAELAGGAEAVEKARLVAGFGGGGGGWGFEFLALQADGAAREVTDGGGGAEGREFEGGGGDGGEDTRLGETEGSSPRCGAELEHCEML